MDILIGGQSTSNWLTSIQLKRSLSSLGACLIFKMQNDDKYRPPAPNVGDRVSLTDGGVTRFAGKVTETTETPNIITVTAYDECYYLNKSKVTIQFADSITTSEAIIALCEKIGVKISHLPLLQNPVNKLFYASAPSDIISDLLEEQESMFGGKYYLTSESASSIAIRQLGSLSAGVTLSAITDAARTVSLDGVKNRVTLLVKDGDNYTVSETASNVSSISQYGLLHEYIVTSLDADTAIAYAQNKLNELSTMLDEGEITILGDWRLTQAGSRLTVVEPITRLSGEYIIESVMHNVADGHHETTLSLKRHYNYTPFKVIVSNVLAPQLKTVEESRKGLLASARSTSYANGKDNIKAVIDYFKAQEGK